MTIKIFADGANLKEIELLAADERVSGFTTNPTLMRSCGVDNYQKFAAEAIAIVGSKPISFEVFSDDLKVMYDQAIKIASWGENVYVKIPISNTQSEPTLQLISRLTNEGVRVNVTAVFTLEQISQAAEALEGTTGSNISVFAGRIADTGRDPALYISHAVSVTKNLNNCEIIWASPREVLNVSQANNLGCHAITMTPALIEKLRYVDKDLQLFSLETVKMFYQDGKSAGFVI